MHKRITRSSRAFEPSPPGTMERHAFKPAAGFRRSLQTPVAMRATAVTFKALPGNASESGKKTVAVKDSPTRNARFQSPRRCDLRPRTHSPKAARQYEIAAAVMYSSGRTKFSAPVRQGPVGVRRDTRAAPRGHESFRGEVNHSRGAHTVCDSGSGAPGTQWTTAGPGRLPESRGSQIA